MYQCPSSFKRNLSYCIPFHSVCNGVLDCPHCEDEAECNNSTVECKGLLKCQKGSLCVHPDHLCDGKVDCPLSADDDSLCDLGHCPKTYVCLSEAYIYNMGGEPLDQSLMSVRLSTVDFNRKLVLTILLEAPKLILLDVSANNLDTLLPYTFRSQYELIILNISYNMLYTLNSSTFFGLNNVRHIYLMGNGIHTIHDGAFMSLTQLTTLDLSHQNLTRVGKYGFWGLFRLEFLNLSGNSINEITEVHFATMSSLHTLDISNNIIKNLNFSCRVFTLRSLKLAFVDSPLLCVLVPRKGQCVSREKHYLTWNPFTYPSIRVVLWSIVVFVSCAKLTAIWYQIRRAQKKSSVYEYSQTVFTMTESWICIYLMILCKELGLTSKNTAYHWHAWLISPLCTFLRAISFTGIHLSSVTFIIISALRYMKIVPAVARYDFGVSVLIPPCLASVLVSLLMVGLLLFSGTNYYINIAGRDPVCLLFFSWPPGALLTAFYAYFLCVNCFLLAVVFLLTIKAALVTITSNQNLTTSAACNIKRQRMETCVRLGMQSCSAMLLPVSASLFPLFIGHFTDHNAYVWFVITVLPVSIVMNFCFQVCFSPAFITDLRRIRLVVTNVGISRN